MAHNTDYQLSMIAKHNRDGTPNLQNDRLRELKNIFKHLQEERGYSKRYDLQKFSRKDVNRLVNDWKEQGLTHGAIRNKVSHLRWLSSKVGDPNAVPKTNRELGIGKKQMNAESKAVELDRSKLEAMPVREQLATELRAEFGLRTEESLKFKHEYATQNKGVITLKDHWTKGGRPRQIAITNDRQRDLLKRVGEHQKANGDRSMIPEHRRFKSYYRDYNETRNKAGVPGHGLRHQWAQDRFESIAGLKSPHAGGPSYNSLSKDDQAKWDRAAEVVNSELGHGKGRQDITATYIGSK